MSKPWWENAVVYQIYPRSFADSDGNGIGDLPGITSRLSYVKELGVDAIWLSPFYPSPQVDAGYDVSDYTDVDPLFGSLADFDALLGTAHGLGLKVIIDLVPNHCSNAHPLFQAALAAKPGSPEREMFHFVTGTGENGENPPNNWRSVFGGPSWTKVAAGPGQEEGDKQWYYHLFASEQPDFNWKNPKVLQYFESVFRFWLDRGVDGFRIDVSDALIKDTTWPNTPDGQPVIPKDEASGVHDIYRSFRRILDSYPGQRMAVIETGAPDEVVAQFLRPDEMQQAFNFRFQKTPWDGPALAKGIRESLQAYASVGSNTTWVTDNHDNVRTVTRYASKVKLSGEYVPEVHGQVALSSAELQTGLHRARAMALLLLTLPGSAYIYAGQELGLPEVVDLPDELRTDPSFFRTQGRVKGRDGCRVPMPWRSFGPTFGFNAQGGQESWLPQPSDWGQLSVGTQSEDSSSILRLYQDVLKLRRSLPALQSENLVWVSEPQLGTTNETVLVLERGDSEAGIVKIIVNFGDQPVDLPEGEGLIVSNDLQGGRLAGNSAALVKVV